MWTPRLEGRTTPSTATKLTSRISHTMPPHPSQTWTGGGGDTQPWTSTDPPTPRRGQTIEHITVLIAPQQGRCHRAADASERLARKHFVRGCVHRSVPLGGSALLTLHLWACSLNRACLTQVRPVLQSTPLGPVSLKPGTQAGPHPTPLIGAQGGGGAWVHTNRILHPASDCRPAAPLRFDNRPPL